VTIDVLPNGADYVPAFTFCDQLGAPCGVTGSPGNGQEPLLQQDTSGWYTSGITIAVYANGNAYFGVENVQGTIQSEIETPNWCGYNDQSDCASPLYYGTPNANQFEVGLVGEHDGEYATFTLTGSASWSPQLAFAAPPLPANPPTPNGCKGGVWYYGESGPMTDENSNFC
jgi:hypothetical protein